MTRFFLRKFIAWRTTYLHAASESAPSRAASPTRTHPITLYINRARSISVAPQLVRPWFHSMRKFINIGLDPRSSEIPPEHRQAAARLSRTGGGTPSPWLRHAVNPLHYISL
jgi:hypothetical protein